MLKKFKWMAAALIVGSFAGAPAEACKQPKFTKAESQVINPFKINQKHYSSAVTKVMNYHRCKAGKSKLKEKSGLRTAATAMSKKMARKNKMYHDSRSQRHARYRKGRIKTKIYAENIALDARLNFGRTPFIAKNQKTCEYVFAHSKKSIPQHTYASLAIRSVGLWVNSPGHRANMMHPLVKSVGNGVAYNPKTNQPCGGFFMTQNFAG